jgi:Cdc6-like AAA superfamily ATPase
MPTRTSTIADILDNRILFASIVGKEAWGWRGIEEWQSKVLLADDPRVLLNISRHGGKSSVLAVKAFHKALTVEKALILIVATERQSKEDLRKVKDCVKAWKDWLERHTDGQVTLTLVSDNETSIEFSNRSRIIALPANEKIRGYSAPTMVIIDEAAFLSDDVFLAVNPMFVTFSEGQLIIASTPKGNDNLFHTAWASKQYNTLTVPWNQIKHIDPKKVEMDRMAWGENYVKQEYEVQFLGETGGLFTEQGLQDSIDDQEEAFPDQISKMEALFGREAEI